jgi:hypothetical protein
LGNAVRRHAMPTVALASRKFSIHARPYAEFRRVLRVKADRPHPPPLPRMLPLTEVAQHAKQAVFAEQLKWTIDTPLDRKTAPWLRRDRFSATPLLHLVWSRLTQGDCRGCRAGKLASKDRWLEMAMLFIDARCRVFEINPTVRISRSKACGTCRQEKASANQEWDRLRDASTVTHHNLCSHEVCWFLHAGLS